MPAARRRLALLVAGAALAVPAPAGAHAWLARAEPADGSRLASAPQEIHLWFTENLASGFRAAQLVGPGGKAIAGARIRAVGGNELAVTMPRLQRGSYALAWRVLAFGDGHATSGTLVFGVGAAPLPSAPVAGVPAPAAVDVVLRWLRFSLLAVLLGGLAFVVGPLRAAGGPVVIRAAGRVLGAAAAAASLALVVQLAAIVRQVDTLGGAGAAGLRTTARELVFGSRWGALWLAEQLLLGVLLAVALRLLRRRPVVGRTEAAVGVVAVAGIGAVEALGSHAAGLDQGYAAVAADGAHLLGAALWLGVVAALALAAWPAFGLGRRDAAGLALAVRRPFAWLAGGSLLVAVVTGLYAAGLQVRSVDALLLTLYGRTLLVKTLLVLVVCALGAANFRLLQRGEPATARIRLEAAAGAAALLAAGVLTAASPARGPEFAEPQAVGPAELTRQTGDLLVTATVRPNRRGPNVVNVLVTSTRRPPPARVTGVRLDLGTGTPVTLTRVGGGSWYGDLMLGSSGGSSMTVAVSRAGGTIATPFRWTVAPPDPARAVVVSRRTLASLVDPAAVLLLLGVAAAAAWRAVARSRRPVPLFTHPKETS